MNLTTEQRAIVERVQRTKDDILIEAVAGSGKTSALIEALKVIPQRSVLVCAYNKKIADELTARIPKAPKGWAFHVKTFHAIGLSILKHHYPSLQIDKNGTEAIINKALNGQTLAYPLRRAAIKLLRQQKETEVCDGLSIAPDVIELEQLGRDYDLFSKLRDDQIDEVCAVVASAYDLSRRPRDLEVIDFCDMIWMPAALGLTPPSRYQAIVVDEWQDISEPQLELIRKLRAPGSGRLIFAGDGMQAINAWRGAVAETVRTMMTVQHKAVVMTLTTSFRCSKAVISEARALVPAIKACDDALDGSVSHVGLCDVPRMIHAHHSDTPHTFVLSRANAALLDAALFLWREGVRFQLNAGQEMLAPLFDALDTLNLSSPELFRKSLKAWHEKQSVRADATGSVELQERLDEQRDMLLAVVNYTMPQGIRRLLHSILEPGRTGVMLSTVHKVKGLEAERVFLLRQTFKRHKEKPDVTQEDLNIEYVAITRAKEHLIWVDIYRREMAGGAYRTLMTDKMLKSLSIEALEQEFIKAEGELQRVLDGNDPDGWADYADLVRAELQSRFPR